MYNDFDNEMKNTFDYEDYAPCFSCPYFFRQLPPAPPFPGGMGNPQEGKPQGPPPTLTPHKSEGISVKSVSPGSIKPCTYRYVYIWLENGRSFWAWLTRVDRRTASGWRWDHRRWVYFGIDLRHIESFECY